MRRGTGTEEEISRAAAHAALGEPVRLAIADLLATGDRSPKELADQSGLPTNLLAYHLAVMTDAGLIRRRRSDGDGRRSYVQLRFEDPLVGSLITAPAMIARGNRVVFVCTANSARSQLAAARWQQVSAVAAESAGTRPAARVHPRAFAVGRRHDLNLRGQRTQHLENVARDGDLVISVCDQAHEELASADAPTALHWSVPDPVPADTDAAFEAALADLSARIDRLTQSMASHP